jgi:cysteine desulfurase
MNRRAGTENCAGIVGFGVAVQLAADDLLNVPQTTEWRDQLQKQLQGIARKDVTVIGEHAPRVANTLCIAMHNTKSETQVMAMDLAGVALSSGSACSSGKVKASHVLRAMGYADDVAGSALRISIGWGTQKTDIERCVEAWQAMYQRMRNKQQAEAA